MNNNVPPPSSNSDYSEVRTASFEWGQAIRDIGEGFANGQKEADSRNHDIESSSTSDNQAKTSGNSGKGGYGKGGYGSQGYGS